MAENKLGRDIPRKYANQPMVYLKENLHILKAIRNPADKLNR